MADWTALQNKDIEVLVLSAQQGDSAAAARLVECMMPLVRRQALRYNSVELDPDDLLQEGLIGLLSAVRGFQPQRGKAFAAYASVCVQNSILSALRRSLGAKSLKAQDVVPWDDDLPLSAPSLEEQQDLREDCARLRRFIEQELSSAERQALHLFLSGFSYAQIAEKMQITQKSVDNALQRVRAKLKK